VNFTGKALHWQGPQVPLRQASTRAPATPSRAAASCARRRLAAEPCALASKRKMEGDHAPQPEQGLHAARPLHSSCLGALPRLPWGCHAANPLAWCLMPHPPALLTANVILAPPPSPPAELCEAVAARKSWRSHKGGRLDVHRAANWVCRAALAGHSGVVLAFAPPAD